MSEAKTTVAFLCPVAESVNPQVFKHSLAAVSTASKHGYHVDAIAVTERTLVHQARNQLALAFKETKCEWAFWMDSDMIIPANTIPQLIESAKQLDTKFITGVYFQRLGQHLPVLWRKTPVLMDGTPAPGFSSAKPDSRAAYMHHFIIPPEKEAIKADVCGFGCVLTHRDMFEKIEFPFFKMISDDCSEDFYFCIKAGEAGYQLWADPTLPLGHMANPAFITRKDMILPTENMVEVQK